MKHIYSTFLLLMVLQSSVFAADWKAVYEAMDRGFERGRASGGGQYSGITAALNRYSEILEQERETKDAIAEAQAVAQYQYQLQSQLQQQQLNQGSGQGQAKIFSSIVYSDVATAQNAYNDFVAGTQNFNGEMFTLNQIQDTSYHSLYDSLQVMQLTTVLQGADGRYYIVLRLQ